MDNPETLARLGTQDTKQTVGSKQTRENRRVNQEWTIQIHWQDWVHKTQNSLQVVNRLQRKPKWQPRMDNPETLARLGTQDTEQNVGSKQTLEKTEGAIKN